MNRTKQYLNNLVNKIITETLQDKADEVMEKIEMGKLKNAPSEFDYVAEGEMCECGSPMVEGECMECGKVSDELMEKLYGGQKKLDKNKNGKIDGQDFKMLRGEMDEDECTECGEMREGDMCECGSSEFYEGECVECGMSKGEMLEFGTGRSDGTAGMELEELEDPSWFEETDDINRELERKKRKDATGNIFHGNRPLDMANMNPEDASDYYDTWMDRKMKGEPGGEDYLTEKRKGGFKDEEMGEGNAFTKKLKDTPKGGKFKLGNKEYTDNSNLDETLYRLVDGEDSALFTENEIIDIIENIVKEEKEKDNIKKGVQHKGLSTYEKVHKGSGKENKEYLDSVAKKMTDYIKDGSKGKYETNPKHFPKGNGQLAKMDKKAYEIDEEGTDFNMQIGGQLIPDYDNGSHPDKKTIEKQIKGSATNGNDPKWANADDTGVNNKFAEYFEEDQLGKWKDESYGRVPSPVYKGKGDNKLKLAKDKSKGKSKGKLKEEFDRIQQLMGYTQKTQ